MTTIYSMAYETSGRQDEQCQRGTKPELSWEQVGTKLGLSWEEVVKLFMALQNQRTMTELKDLYHWANTTKFRTKYITPLIEAQLVGMTFPDKPTSPNQRYFLTDSGKALLANMNCNPNASDVAEKVSHMIGALSKEEKRIALDFLQREHKN
jgi:ATP-dependent DNA helicase RecG